MACGDWPTPTVAVTVFVAAPLHGGLGRIVATARTPTREDRRVHRAPVGEEEAGIDGDADRGAEGDQGDRRHREHLSTLVPISSARFLRRERGSARLLTLSWPRARAVASVMLATLRPLCPRCMPRQRTRGRPCARAPRNARRAGAMPPRYLRRQQWISGAAAEDAAAVAVAPATASGWAATRLGQPLRMASAWADAICPA